MSFIDELRQKLPISGSDSGSELFDLHLGLRTACAEVDRLRAENAKLREFLIELHSYLMQQIGAKTLNDSAKDGTQAISRKLSEILDALRPVAQEPHGEEVQP